MRTVKFRVDRGADCGKCGKTPLSRHDEPDEDCESIDTDISVPNHECDEDVGQSAIEKAKKAEEDAQDATYSPEADKEVMACLWTAVVNYSQAYRELEEELDEWNNARKFVEEPCEDEVHCGCVPILRKMLAERDREIESWQYHLAYLTDEDIATPEGVKAFVMGELEKLRKKVHIWMVASCRDAKSCEEKDKRIAELEQGNESLRKDNRKWAKLHSIDCQRIEELRRENDKLKMSTSFNCKACLTHGRLLEKDRDIAGLKKEHTDELGAIFRLVRDKKTGWYGSGAVESLVGLRLAEKDKRIAELTGIIEFAIAHYKKATGYKDTGG